MRIICFVVWLLICAALQACGGGSGTEGTVGEQEDTDTGSTNVAEVNSAPKIRGTPVTSLYEGDAYSFVPLAEDADNDALSFSVENAPDWATFDSSTGKLSGKPGANDVGTYTDIRIRVSDGSDEAALPAFDIAVKPCSYGSFTLSWQAPFENTDGTPLEDLDGFNIYWGESPENYSNLMTIENEGLTSYFIDGLEAGTYYFAVAAFNSWGKESEISEPAEIVVR